MANLKFPAELEPLTDPNSGRVTTQWYRTFKTQEQWQLPAFKVANLPSASVAGRVAFASNGRKSGEGVGAGTGVQVYADGVAWRRVSDDTTVAA